MTPEEVFNITGSKGTVVAKSGTDGDSDNTVIYKFETDGDSSVSEMTFVGDKLSYKAQIKKVCQKKEHLRFLVVKVLTLPR